MSAHRGGLLHAISEALRGWLAPSVPEAKAAHEEREVHAAVAALLADIARVASSRHPHAWTRAARALADLFRIDTDEGRALIAAARERTSRVPSCLASVSVLNQHWSAEQKVRFMEYVWRVACADGEIGLYQDRIVHRLADQLGVADADLVTTRNRVRSALKARR
jgi:uncharacterized tellurite resistance protein B-like protein